MRTPRGVSARILAAALGAWLGLVMIEPMQLDACPMHGAHALHGGSGTPSAAHHGHSRHEHAPKKASNQCTCIGACSLAGGSPALTAPKYAAAPGARILLRPEALTPAVPLLRVGLAEHALPPANGPPAIS